MARLGAIRWVDGGLRSLPPDVRLWLAVLTAHIISGGHAFSVIQIEAVV